MKIDVVTFYVHLHLLIFKLSLKRMVHMIKMEILDGFFYEGGGVSRAIYVF